MRITNLCLILGIAISLLACQTTEQNPQKPTETQVAMVGNDRDKHGCKASAGYIWSELKGECVRIWEVATTIYYKKPQGNTYQGIYAIILPDSSRIETYENQHLIWERKGNLPVWENKEFNKTLTQTDSIYAPNDSVSFPIWVME